VNLSEPRKRCSFRNVFSGSVSSLISIEGSSGCRSIAENAINSYYCHQQLSICLVAQSMRNSSPSSIPSHRLQSFSLYAFDSWNPIRAIRDLSSARAGWYGEVYRARDQRLCREVALKILRCNLPATPMPWHVSREKAKRLQRYVAKVYRPAAVRRLSKRSHPRADIMK